MNQWRNTDAVSNSSLQLACECGVIDVIKFIRSCYVLQMFHSSLLSFSHYKIHIQWFILLLIQIFILLCYLVSYWSHSYTTPLAFRSWLFLLYVCFECKSCWIVFNHFEVWWFRHRKRILSGADGRLVKVFIIHPFFSFLCVYTRYPIWKHRHFAFVEFVYEDKLFKYLLATKLWHTKMHKNNV